jgi:hypothetical protein
MYFKFLININNICIQLKGKILNLEKKEKLKLGFYTSGVCRIIIVKRGCYYLYIYNIYIYIFYIL